MNLEVKSVPVLTLLVLLSVLFFDVSHAAEFRGGGIANKCLDMAEAEDGTRVQFWSCHDGANQSWTILPNGVLQGLKKKCLDWDTADGERDGTRVQMWACHYGANQQWTLTKGEIRSNGGLCLSAPIGQDNSPLTADGTSLILSKCDGNKSQKWIVQ